MSLETFRIKGVAYIPLDNPENSCEGCAGMYDSNVCSELGGYCSYKIWVIKEDKLQDYIQKIEEKYPEEDEDSKKYKHYFKDVSNLNYIDIYRVLSLWNVTDPCIQHAVKKLLVAGNRGYKDVEKDIQEAIDSLERWKEMQKESL